LQKKLGLLGWAAREVGEQRDLRIHLAKKTAFAQE
tara:strand:+ start:551 stop:655 length:105 start_codon:yes stop_codon:yes gene_type:complete